MTKPKLDLKTLYITKPYSNARYHVFNKKDNRALCGKVMMLRVDKNNIESVTGIEQYHKGQDCKECFRRAELKARSGLQG